jgi:hypothetical protein
MHKSLKMVGYSLAIVGFVRVVKHIMHCKECSLWHKIKVEDKKPASETEPNNTKENDEKRTGSRYGSNPVKY